MTFKFLPQHLKKQVNNILNKNTKAETITLDSKPVSTFDMSKRHLTTLNSGKVVPIYFNEMLPGDLFKCDVSTLIRMATPQASTMESGTYDVNFFFVPLRLVYPEIKYFFGENKSAGFQEDYTTLPLINYDVDLSYDANDLASYLGIPQSKNMKNIGVPINSLIFKSFIQIWNDYYRDQNVQSEIDNTNNNSNTTNVIVSNYINKPINESLQIGKGLPNSSRLTDYFSTCLPYPQKGDSVNINTLPLQNLLIQNTDGYDSSKFLSPNWYYLDGNNITAGSPIIGENVGGTVTGSVKDTSVKSQVGTSLKIVFDGNAQPYNINDLRLSIAIQHMRELDARGGTRYNEMLKSHFGVLIEDSVVQRAEMIGGFKDNINIDNIVQSSSSVNNSPLGVMGGVSVSSGQTPSTIEYAVKEHGYIFANITIRPQVNYSQGLAKAFTRVERFDYFDPLFDHIGEQPVLKYEIYLDDTVGTSNTNNVIFGYNEAWADYRYSLNTLSGYMSVNSSLPLTSLYSYTENYTNAPTLSNDWMQCSDSIIGSTLLLNNDKLEYIHQFLADFYFKIHLTRPMSLFSTPGIHKI